MLERRATVSGSPARRFPYLVVGLAVLFVALYIVVVLLYAHGGRTDQGEAIDNSQEGMHVVLTPRDVDAAADRIKFDLAVASGSGVVSDDGATVLEDFELMLSSSDETAGRVTTYKQGARIAPSTVELHSEGTIEKWPFDAHESRTMLLVSIPSEEGDDATAVPATLTLGPHHVPGWSITLTEDRSSGGVTADGVAVREYVIEAHRATATVAFGLMLLALMVTMPVLGLTVAILVLRGRRRVEVGFLTWNAGMLFATPMLRNFLPGQPPIGSWADYLVVLWVIAGLILALVISVVAWYRWGTAQHEDARRL